MHQWDRDTSGRLHRISTQIDQGSEVSVHTDTMEHLPEVTGPDPDTPPGFLGWSRLVEFHCTIPRECTRGPHLKEK